MLAGRAEASAMSIFDAADAERAKLGEAFSTADAEVPWSVFRAAHAHASGGRCFGAEADIMY